MHRLDRTTVPIPACLAKYQHGTHTWDDVNGADKREIRQCLEAMQGRRCAYCEASTDDFDHHIEHFRRKKHHPALTFAWDNLFLCCGKDDRCGHHKDRGDRQYNWQDLINPTIDEPDDFLWFHESGAVAERGGCTSAQAQRAHETIRVLNLMHGDLRSMRARQLKWYMQTDPDVFTALMDFPPEERTEYIREELAAVSREPFCTIIRHFFQGLA